MCLDYLIETRRLTVVSAWACLLTSTRLAFSVLGLPMDGEKRRPPGSTYASAMKDPDNPLVKGNRELISVNPLVLSLEKIVSHTDAIIISSLDLGGRVAREVARSSGGPDKP